MKKKDLKVKKSDGRRVSYKSASNFFIVFIVPVVLYIQTVSFDFVRFDDNEIIVKHKDFLSSLSNLGQAFSTDAFLENNSLFYRPLQTISYMFDFKLSSANNATTFHLTNVFLLGLVSCSILALLLRFRVPLLLAQLSTIVYCSHPLFVSSIAWIPARGDLLLMFFSLASIIFLIDYLNNKSTKTLLFHFGAFFLALLSKETAAFLPFIFILYGVMFTSEKFFSERNFIIWCSYLLCGGLWFYIRFRVVHMVNMTDGLVGLKPILFNLQVLPESLSKFFIPYNIGLIPSFSKFGFYSGSLIILMLLLFSIRRLNKIRENWFFIFWFFLFLIPTLFYKNNLIDYLNHRFFLPLLGVYMLLIVNIPYSWSVNKLSSVKWVLIFLIVYLGGVSFVLARSYENASEFYNDAIKRNPKSIAAYSNRSFLHYDQKDYKGAWADANKTIMLDVNYYNGYIHRGRASSMLGYSQNAIVDFNKAVELNQNFFVAYLYRGIEYYDLKKFDLALFDFNKCIKLNPNCAEAYNYKGCSIVGLNGNIIDAIQNYNKAIEIGPNYMAAFGNRAIAKYYLKDYDGAILDCNKVLELSPENSRAKDLLNMIYLAKDNFPKY